MGLLKSILNGNRWHYIGLFSIDKNFDLMDTFVKNNSTYFLKDTELYKKILGSIIHTSNTTFLYFYDLGRSNNTNHIKKIKASDANDLLFLTSLMSINVLKIEYPNINNIFNVSLTKGISFIFNKSENEINELLKNKEGSNNKLLKELINIYKKLDIDFNPMELLLCFKSACEIFLGLDEEKEKLTSKSAKEKTPSIKAKTKFCIKCGVKLNKDQKFCGSCGHKI